MDIMKHMEAETERLGYPLEITPKGNGIITIPGEKSDQVIGISAHLDTLGAMVRSIKPNGMIRFTPVGGYAMHTVEGEYCLIHTRDGRKYAGTVLSTKASVHVFSDARDWKREEANMEIRIDELVKTKADTEGLGISVGDFISWEPRTRILPNGFVKSRHLDDKASVAALLGFMEWLKREGRTPSRTLKLILSTYEEVGHGSSNIPADITEMIAVDMGALGDDLSATEQDVSICAKDSTGPYDYQYDLPPNRTGQTRKTSLCGRYLSALWLRRFSSAARRKQYPCGFDRTRGSCLAWDGTDACGCDSRHSRFAACLCDGVAVSKSCYYIRYSVHTNR